MKLTCKQFEFFKNPFKENSLIFMGEKPPVLAATEVEKPKEKRVGAQDVKNKLNEYRDKRKDILQTLDKWIGDEDKPEKIRERAKKAKGEIEVETLDPVVLGIIRNLDVATIEDYLDKIDKILSDYTGEKMPDRQKELLATIRKAVSKKPVAEEKVAEEEQTTATAKLETKRKAERSKEATNAYDQAKIILTEFKKAFKERYGEDQYNEESKSRIKSEVDLLRQEAMLFSQLGEYEKSAKKYEAWGKAIEPAFKKEMQRLDKKNEKEADDAYDQAKSIVQEYKNKLIAEYGKGQYDTESKGKIKSEVDSLRQEAIALYTENNFKGAKEKYEAWGKAIKPAFKKEMQRLEEKENT